MAGENGPRSGGFTFSKEKKKDKSTLEYKDLITWRQLLSMLNPAEFSICPQFILLQFDFEFYVFLNFKNPYVVI